MIKNISIKDLSIDEVLCERTRKVYIDDRLVIEEEVIIEMYAGEVDCRKLVSEEYYTTNTERGGIVLISMNTIVSNEHETTKILRFADDSEDGKISISNLPDDGRGWLLLFDRISSCTHYKEDGSCVNEISTEVYRVYG